MKGLPSVLILSLLSILAMTPLFSMPALEPPSYYAEIDYVLTHEEKGEIVFKSGDAKDLIPPPPPNGYSLYYLEALFPEGLPRSVAPLRYDKELSEKGMIKSLISYGAPLRLATIEELTLRLKVRSIYVRRKWMKLGLEELVFNVKPPVKPYTLDNMTIRVVLDAKSPYFIKDVFCPNGEALSEIDKSSPNIVRADIKSVEFSAGVCGPGRYKIELGLNDKYKLTSKYLLIQMKPVNYTIGPVNSKEIRIKELNGWSTLGAVVIAYSLIGNLTTLRLEGGLVDHVYSKKESFRISSPSFLIPPMRLNLNVKVFTVYGDRFRVVNPSHESVTMMCMPLYFKDVGYWTPEGVIADVGEEECIKEAVNAYLVVWTPFYGRIIEIKTPSGSSYFKQAEVVEDWGDGLRTVGINLNRAFIQVKTGNNLEKGTYFFKIEWDPVKFKLIDHRGRPLRDAKVTLAGPFSETRHSNERGEVSFLLYVPDTYRLEIFYKGLPVARLTLGTLTSLNRTVKCPVYDLNLVVVGRRGQALDNVKVMLLSVDGKTVAVNTSRDGIVVFSQVPKGKYLVKAIYKRLSSISVISFERPEYLTLTVDILLELPYFGIPISTMEFVAIAVFMSVIALSYTALLRKKQKEGYFESTSLQLS